jgi:SAM-dependent methyltransferase
VVGIDSSPDMIAAALRRGLDARVMDAHALAFENEFDAVFSNAVLHWIKDDPDAPLAGAFRALKFGGRFVGELGGHACVAARIGGDFNVIPEDIDCHKPSSWEHDALFQPEPRDRYRAMLGLGYTDAFRSLHPNGVGQFTFWDYFRQAFKNNRGIRIDHFLLSPVLADRLESCEIDKEPRAQEKPSDHTPIIVTLSDLP